MKYKFKKDGCGWKYLRIELTDSKWLQISIDMRVEEGSSPLNFISISDGAEYASFDLSVAQLRKIAKRILKETSK